MKKQFCIVVGIITNDKNEILLARRNEPKLLHAHNKWEFIGGGINFGETPEEALLREVKEEAGVEVKIVRLLPKIVSHVWEFPEEKVEQVLIISYECKIIGGEPTANLDEEIAELKFVPIEDIKNYDTLPNVYEMAKLILEKP